MRASETAYDLIKAFESLRLRAYKCPAGLWTIGWGSTRNVRQGDYINEEQAIEKLLIDVKFAERDLRGLLKVEVTQPQYDALVSWVFNLGATEDVKNSTLLRKLNEGLPGVADQFVRWNKAKVDGKLQVLKGLTRRRITEARLFETGEFRIEI